jgi:uncharacterized membrane protein YfcA
MLAELQAAEVLFAVAVLILAYIVRGVAGFGSALVAVPLLAWVMPLTTVVPVIIGLDYFAAISQGRRDTASIQWRELWPLIPPALIGTIAALFLFKNLDADLLVRVLAFFVMGFSLYMLRPIQNPGHRGRVWALPSGVVGGLVGTLFATGGPFYVIYLRLRQLDKRPFLATLAVIFLIDGSFKIGGFLIADMLEWEMLLLVLAALPLKVFGLFLGHRIHDRLEERVFVRFVALLLFLSGFSLLLKTL